MFDLKRVKITCLFIKLNVNFKTWEWNTWIEKRNYDKWQSNLRLQFIDIEHDIEFKRQ